MSAAKPLQVYLDADDLARLDTWSQARGWTKSQTIRAAIRALTQPPATDALSLMNGMIDGLPADLSMHLDRYLNATFVAEKAPRYGRSRRARRPVVRR